MTAYHKATRWTGWWLVFCFLGVAGQLGFMYFLWAAGLMDRLKAWVIPIGGIPFVVAVIAAMLLLKRLNRQRVERVAVSLDGLGFRVEQNPSHSAKTEFCAPIAALLPYLNLGRGAAGVRWCAIQREGAGVRALFFEHQYFTGSGKSIQEHNHTLIAWPAGHLDIGNCVLPQLPWFTMGRYAWLARRVYKEVELSDAAFADLTRDWCLTRNAATATAFLTPKARTELLHSPKGEAWYVGAGWVWCSFLGTLDAENTKRFVAHARAVISA